MSPTAEELTARIVDLESVIAHLQYDLERMSSVIVAQGAELERLGGRLAKLDEELVRMSDEEKPASSVDEKPPHY